MENRNSLYVGIAYSALDIPDYNAVMSAEWFVFADEVLNYF